MKKLFFFRSSQSGSGNKSAEPPLPDKQTWENTSDSVSSPCLRRSASYSSAFHDNAMGRKNLSRLSGSPSSGSHGSLKRTDRHSTRRAPTPERQSKAKYLEGIGVQNAHGIEKPVFAGTRFESSESSSYSSSNVSNKVLDRYIDGEQHQERHHAENGNGKRPPRVQYTAPASPTDCAREKQKSHSFREAKGTNLCFSSRDWVENGFGHESPRTLAKHVIERLSQSRVLAKTSSKELDPDVPITIEDIYDGSLYKCPRDGPDESTSGYQNHKEISGFNNGFLSSVEAQEIVDVELLRKSKEAEERVVVLSEELEQEIFLHDIGFSVPELIQTIRHLMEERISMALEVSNVLQDRIVERASTKEEVRLVRAELESKTRRLEKEKNELQSTLEKELDRRSSDWSFKLEKYQAEEHRLRERVRELAEQNVSLQREVSSFSARDVETTSRITYSEEQLKDLTKRMEETREENQNLLQNLSGLREKYTMAEEDRECVRKNYQEKERECKELHKSITRLLRTCSEQEKTIDGLREGLSEEIRTRGSVDNIDKQLRKFQTEQMRLTGVEQALRKEAESFKIEVDSLRHENINLLQRLKESGQKGGFSTFKLDQEMRNRVFCLQNQGLTLLKESTQLCSKLLEYTKRKAGQINESKQGTEVEKNGLDGQFVIDTDIKVQGFKRGTETLRRSLETIAVVLHEKSNIVDLESHSHCLEDESGLLNDRSFEDTVRSELKAETLVTSLLRDKLYSKEQDKEQLQAELAAAVRGNDVLKCEVQSALDNISCLTHKMKDLEIQIIKKDENINQLQNELQECRKEATIMRGLLPKVSEERDMMWEEVKQYSEKTMLLNSEVSVLKKKIESLDEDLLLKEGQITILKDTLGKPFDLLASPDSMREFQLV